MPRPKASSSAVTRPGSVWRSSTPQKFEAGRAHRQRDLAQFARGQRHHLVEGAGQDRQHHQASVMMPASSEARMPDRHHHGKAERAVDDAGDAPHHVQRQPDEIGQARVRRGIDVQVENGRRRNERGQERAADGQVERAEDGVEDAAALAQIEAGRGGWVIISQLSACTPRMAMMARIRPRMTPALNHAEAHGPKKERTFHGGGVGCELRACAACQFSFPRRTITARAEMLKMITTISSSSAAPISADSYSGMDIISP